MPNFLGLLLILVFGADFKGFRSILVILVNHEVQAICLFVFGPILEFRSDISFWGQFQGL